MKNPEFPISATVITLNEEKNITACVNCLSKICDEVVVVDSQSSDKTVDFARQAGAKVYTQAYLGDGLQKARAAELAENDWILSMDADERPDADLCALLPTLRLDNASGYAFRRKNHIGKEPIRAGSYYPDYVTRLYNKKYSAYNAVQRHGRVQAAKVVKCNAHIVHYTYDNLSDWIARINQLTTRDAMVMYKGGVAEKSPGAHALVAFLRKYIFKGGCFQGQDGLTVAVATAFSCYMKYLKLRELHRQK